MALTGAAATRPGQDRSDLSDCRAELPRIHRGAPAREGALGRDPAPPGGGPGARHRRDQRRRRRCPA
ncbi:MAG: hypothetical protein MZW92_60990 [Comamonadaceae bacterium]|nr:hypothetical protein [Comamonadaceae bacterium]